MTLRELVANHYGCINIGVYGSETDEKAEFVFPSDLHDKIKDEIMDKEIACYKVKPNRLLVPEIHVILAQDEIQKEVTEDADR